MFLRSRLSNNEYLTFYTPGQPPLLKYRPLKDPYILLSLREWTWFHAEIDDLEASGVLVYGHQLWRPTPRWEYLFTSVRKVMLATKIISELPVFQLPENQAVLDILKAYSQQCKIIQEAKPPRKLPKASRPISDFVQDAEVVTGDHNNKISIIRDQQYPYLKHIHKQYECNDRSISDIEAFLSGCYYLLLGDQHYLAIPIHDAEGKRHGIAVNYLSSFVTVEAKFQGNPIPEKVIVDDRFMPIWVASGILYEFDLHLFNIGYDASGVLKKIDNDRSFWDETAKFHNVDPMLGLKHKRLPRGEAAYYLTPPVISTRLSAENIASFPYYRNSEPQMWITNHRQKKFFGHIDFKSLLKTNKKIFKDKYYVFLEQLLAPKKIYEELADLMMHSEKTKGKMVKKIDQIITDLRPALIHDAGFQQFIKENPRVIDEVIDDFRTRFAKLTDSETCKIILQQANDAYLLILDLLHWSEFKRQFPVFQYQTTTKCAPVTADCMQSEFYLKDRLVKIVASQKMKQESPYFFNFLNLLSRKDVEKILMKAANNHSRFDTNAVHITFTSEYIHEAITVLRKKNEHHPKEGLTKKQVDRLHELIAAHPKDQHQVFYSAEYNAMQLLSSLIPAGKFATEMFRDLLFHRYFPYVILSMMNSIWGKDITYAQLFTMLELYQAITPRKIFSANQVVPQIFPSEVSTGLPDIYSVLDDFGEWTEQAKLYFLPAIRFNEALDRLKMLIQTLPKSEQIFVNCLQGKLNSNLVKEGIVYRENGNHLQDIAVEPSCSIRNVIGVMKHGDHFVPLIPQVGPISLDSMVQGMRQNVRYAQIHIVTAVGGYSGINQHESFYSHYQYEKYYSDTYSTLPKYCRDGLHHAIDVVRAETNITWSRPLWCWANAAFQLFRDVKYRVNGQNIHMLPPMAQFCVMFETGQDPQGNPVINGLMKDRTFQSIEGAIVFLDMVKNYVYWANKGLNRHYSSNAQIDARLHQLSVHHAKGYLNQFDFLHARLWLLRNFFHEPIALQVIFLQLLEECNIDMNTQVDFAEEEMKDLFDFIRDHFEFKFVKQKNHEISIVVNDHYHSDSIINLHSLFQSKRHILKHQPNTISPEKLNLCLNALPEMRATLSDFCKELQRELNARHLATHFQEFNRISQKLSELLNSIDRCVIGNDVIDLFQIIQNQFALLKNKPTFKPHLEWSRSCNQTIHSLQTQLTKRLEITANHAIKMH